MTDKPEPTSEHIMTPPSALDLRWTCTGCDWTAGEAFVFMAPEDRGASFYARHGATDRPEPTAEHIDAETFADELDDHIAESMYDPEYAAATVRPLSEMGDPDDDKPEPTAEHIDAIALWHDPTKLEWQWVAREAWPELAGALDRTDPATQAANLPTDVMLTALVERGWKPDAVARVEALHARRRGKDPVTLGPRDYCSSHDHPSLTDWPCRTIRALMEPAP